ncbi:MAG: O-antigen ligase family protein [Candidatus Uhrbacteria bacterium]|nr:O-antigen ligase family protein [Candidatus Uhrbacteria bacterium]
MNLKRLNAQTIVQGLLCLLLLTPLIYLPWLWRPAQTSKFLFFVILLEVIFLVVLSLFKCKSFVFALKHPVIQIFGAYTACVALTSFFGVDPINSFWGNDVRIGGWLLLVHAWIFCVFLFTFFDRALWNRAEKIFIFSGILVSCYALLEVLHIVPSLGIDLPRATSIIGNPIYLAAYLIFPFTVALLRVAQKEKQYRVYYLVASIVIFLGILSSGTRGAFLGMIIGTGIAGVYALKQFKNWKKMYVVIALLLILCSSVFFVGRSVIPKNSFSYRFFHFSDGNALSRLEFWKMAFEGVREHPLIGVGYENFYRVSEQHYSSVLYGEEGNYSDKPHNIYIEILVSSGIIGLLLYLTLIGFVFRSIRCAAKNGSVNAYQEAILYFGFIAYLIQNFFAFDTITTFFTSSFFFAYVSFLGTDPKHILSTGLLQRSKNAAGIFFVCTFLVFGYLLFAFYVPTYSFFAEIAKANDQSDEIKRFSILQAIPRDEFMYDRNALGKLYYNGGKTLYNKVGGTQDVKNYIGVGLQEYAQIVKDHPLRGEYWFPKADLGLMRAFVFKQPVDEETKFAIEKTLELTPTRTEPYLVKATEMEMEGDLQGAITMLEGIHAKIPDSNKLLWTMSVLYAKLGKDDLSAQYGYQSIDLGLPVAGVQSILDLVNYFADKHDYEKVIVLYKRAVHIFPESVDLYANLAAAYAANGQTPEAIDTARKYEQLKPEVKTDTDAFIRSLQR